MGQNVSRIHNMADNKSYNILPTGQIPTVVFGRRLKENSVPGMQYYFSDGRVKWYDGDDDFVKPFPTEGDDASTRQWGIPCIFTVPEDYDWNKIMNKDYDYIKSCCRKADKLNANTMSPNYIIRNGEIVCIKTLEAGGKFLVLKEKKMQTYNSYDEERIHRKKITCGKLISYGDWHGTLHNLIQILNSNKNKLRNNITVIPVGRVKHNKRVPLPNDGDNRYHCKKSIHYYNLRKLCHYDWMHGEKKWGFKQV